VIAEQTRSERRSADPADDRCRPVGCPGAAGPRRDRRRAHTAPPCDVRAPPDLLRGV